MFFFLFPALLTYNWILILAAVIPAIVLIGKVYRADRLDKESPASLWPYLELFPPSLPLSQKEYSEPF